MTELIPTPNMYTQKVYVQRNLHGYIYIYIYMPTKKLQEKHSAKKSPHGKFLICKTSTRFSPYKQTSHCNYCWGKEIITYYN